MTTRFLCGHTRPSPVPGLWKHKHVHVQGCREGPERSPACSCTREGSPILAQGSLLGLGLVVAEDTHLPLSGIWVRRASALEKKQEAAAGRLTCFCEHSETTGSRQLVMRRTQEGGDQAAPNNSSHPGLSLHLHSPSLPYGGTPNGSGTGYKKVQELNNGSEGATGFFS